MEELLKNLGEDLDAIVVEGYDGVGKGKILNELSEYYGVKPYRPDYNLWQQFDHRNVDRWKISGFFWDVYSHFHPHGNTIMLFDRGVISGAVYNDDLSIAEHYREMIRDMNILHVLVTCSARDYYRFAKARNPLISDGVITDEWEKCEEYTVKYIKALKAANVDYLIIENKYEEDLPQDICKSCGHYSYGYCNHPKIKAEVDGDNERCELSTDKEVQDL